MNEERLYVELDGQKMGILLKQRLLNIHGIF